MIEEFLKEFGDKLPNPDHYPAQVAYLVKLFLYDKSIKTNR